MAFPPSAFGRNSSAGSSILFTATTSEYLHQVYSLERYHNIAVIDFAPVLARPALTEENLANLALQRDSLAYDGLETSEQRARREKRERQERKDKWLREPDPFVAWNTPPILPESAFYREPVPSCVAALTGIPNSAEGYSRVCMRHPLRKDLSNPYGRPIPIFARVVSADADVTLGKEDKEDLERRRELTERFDLQRVDRALALARRNGGRNEEKKCLRCSLMGLPCSFERKGRWESKFCEGCRRNGCKFCLRVAGDEDALEEAAEHPWVRIERVEGRKKTARLLWVLEDEGETVDLEMVSDYAEELLEGERTVLWGETLSADEAAGLVLPVWGVLFDPTQPTPGIWRTVVNPAA